jgi:hypothetical protein
MGEYLVSYNIRIFLVFYIFFFDKNSHALKGIRYSPVHLNGRKS